MSSLITKATKRGLSASKRIRATKGKKAASRKPKRPGRITATPKKKPPVGKKLPQAKKSKHATAAKKLSSRTIKKVVPKKKSVTVAPAKRRKVAIAKRPSPKKAPARLTAIKKRPAKPQSRKAMLARRRALVPRPLPAPPKKPPSPGTLAAVRAFEQALRLFNRQDFGTARSAFLSLLGKFAEQVEIVARARTYLAICEQRLARSPSVPRNLDALYNQGVFQLNRGNTAEAIELFEKALKVEPRADHVYYSLAAAYARLNDTPKAMEALRRAIGIRPVHRSHARRDLDFAGLRSNEDFQQLTGFGFDLIDE
ncbi:MAG TPA: tetratricopeptide repeat protein [Blastocatellia bacterium]|nr:tetratricopeptide repeat protein [Blastocatellia bacterium]